MTTTRNLSNASHFSGKTSSFKSHIKPTTHSVKKEAVKYDWENKWLKGEEYANMLTNIDQYCQTFDLAKLAAKTHPSSIYTEPENGMIYFVQGNSVGSDFGFPRVDTKKHYRWKKMNFTTDLPKKRPYVTYIVASAVKCERFFPNSKDEGPSYRMHAVILNKDRVHTQKYKSKTASQSQTEHDENSQALSSTCSSADSLELEKNEMVDELSEARQTPVKGEKNYILCHIRKIDSNYKMARSGSKKGSVSKDEEGGEDLEDEEEEDDEECEDVVVKKQFTLQESGIIAKEKADNKIERINAPTIPPLKITSIGLQNQSHNESEASSPLESLMPKVKSVSSPGGLMKTNLFGLGTRNSAFNNFQVPCITPKFSKQNLKPISIPKTQEKKKEASKVKLQSKKPLFEAFNLIDTTNVDYYTLFTSLINIKKK